MFNAAFRVLNFTAMGGIVGAILDDPLTAIVGGALGLAVGSLQEVGRLI